MNITSKYIWFVLVFLSIGLFSCKNDSKKGKGKQEERKALEAFTSPEFNVDSAFFFIEKQLSFGHRVPGFKEHEACKDWFVKKLNAYGGAVEVQSFKSSFLSIREAPSYNVIASFNPGANKRILLAAHWDSRLIAEKDGDETKRNSPIMGADDGASGVGVLLELARIIKKNPLKYVGIDIVLFDAEDQGYGGQGWCQGSIYWANNPHRADYTANYGILLDMIGAKGAQFGYESISETFAKKHIDKVWGLAHHLGYDDLFVSTKTGEIMDDHYAVNAILKIPMIDIINRPLITDHGFGDYHHTHNDDISIIDKNVLQKVGHVITDLVYREDNGKI